MLYPVLFYFTHFFRELSVYEQIFFALGSSALYTGLGVPLSITSAIRYPGVFYLPLMLLSVSVIATIYIVFFMARSYDPLTTLLWILPTSYLLNLITGVISILRRKNILRLRCIIDFFYFPHSLLYKSPDPENDIFQFPREQE